MLPFLINWQPKFLGGSYCHAAFWDNLFLVVTLLTNPISPSLSTLEVAYKNCIFAATFCHKACQVISVVENISKSLILQHCERSELRLFTEIHLSFWLAKNQQCNVGIVKIEVRQFVWSSNTVQVFWDLAIVSSPNFSTMDTIIITTKKSMCDQINAKSLRQGKIIRFPQKTSPETPNVTLVLDSWSWMLKTFLLWTSLPTLFKAFCQS